MWRYISRGQLGVKFCRQMPVGPFFADFLCRALKLIVELDGHSHDVRPERDRARDRYLAAAGFRVVRFANADVMRDVGAVVEAVRLEVAALRCLPRAHP